MSSPSASAAASSEDQNERREQVECPVCLNRFDHTTKARLPRLLSCGHSLCTSCLEAIYKKSSGSAIKAVHGGVPASDVSASMSASAAAAAAADASIDANQGLATSSNATLFYPHHFFLLLYYLV
jgi:hypothetical protein